MSRALLSLLALLVALAATGPAVADPPEPTAKDLDVDEKVPDLDAIAAEHRAAMEARAERARQKLLSAEGQTTAEPARSSVAPARRFEPYNTSPKSIE